MPIGRNPNLNENEIQYVRNEYHVGPSKDALSENVWDSGFRQNVNALSIRNFAYSPDAKGGVCAGFAIFAENTFNGNFSVKNRVYANGLTYDNFSRYILSKNWYGYNPESEKFKSIYNRPSGECYSDEDVKGETDKELIDEIVYLWGTQGLNIANLNGDMYISEYQINALKDLFKNGKIVSIGLHQLRGLKMGAHAINGYALEKMSNNEYRLYVYDSNMPYNPYLKRAENQNTYITLKRSCNLLNSWGYTYEYNPGYGLYWKTGIGTGLDISYKDERIYNDGRYNY